MDICDDEAFPIDMCLEGLESSTLLGNNNQMGYFCRDQIHSRLIRFVDYLLAYILKNTRLCFCFKDMWLWTLSRSPPTSIMKCECGYWTLLSCRLDIPNSHTQYQWFHGIDQFLSTCFVIPLWHHVVITTPKASLYQCIPLISTKSVCFHVHLILVTVDGEEIFCHNLVQLYFRLTMILSVWSFYPLFGS